MLILVLLAVAVLIGIIAFLGISLVISKAINGFFFGIFGNLFVLVKIFTWIKKIVIIGIIVKLFSMEKAKKAEKAD